MKKLFQTLAILSFLLLLYGCPLHYGYDYPNGKIPETPVNISSANSEYDDINMSAPTLFEETLLIFSSNRKSKGANFDLVFHPITFNWSKKSGVFSTEDQNPEAFKYLGQLLEKANTGGNEYGPFSFFQTYYTNNKYYDKQYLFYSSDSSGTNNIYLITYNFSEDSSYTWQFDLNKITGPLEVPFLNNNSFDEMYLTLKMSPWEYGYHLLPTNNVFEKIIYCENSSGNFDLTSIDIPENIPLDSFLIKGENVSKVKISNLNSNYNDRCPYVCGNFMVFSSDRPGGLGGYDLYWSTYNKGNWSAPVNFGAPINSESNEFRAIADYAHEFENQLLIFSSDRPGGKGGYDLYYVGIDVMPELIY